MSKHLKVLKEFFALHTNPFPNYADMTQQMLNSYKLNQRIKVHSSANSIMASYGFNTKTLNLYPNGIYSLQEFLFTILHEIDHMINHKKMGKKFIEQYTHEMNILAAKYNNPYKHNKFEKEAERFAHKEYNKWKNYF